MDIRVIRDKRELEGTCYFELLPGTYQGKCWNDNSVFISEEVFGFIEPVIERHEPRFDHYSFVGISKETWERIIPELKALARRLHAAQTFDDLRGEFRYLLDTTAGQLGQNFETNSAALIRLLTDLCDWFKVQLQSHGCVSVLGM